MGRQTTPMFKDKDEWRSLNAGDPENDNYSILDQLESFRGTDGKFLMKMVWPDSDSYNVWKQSSNPVTATARGVDGYEAIDVRQDSNYWGGLEYSKGKNSLLDGSVDHSNWWFAAGSTRVYNGGIPAYD